jgi:hypothetical protein
MGEFTMDIMEVAEQASNDDRSLLLHTSKCCVARVDQSTALDTNTEKIKTVVFWISHKVKTVNITGISEELAVSFFRPIVCL